MHIEKGHAQKFAGGGSPPPRSEDRLLLDEAHHRTANEIAAALAALRLIKSAKGAKSRWHLLTTAIDRLEGFGEAHAVLGGRLGPTVELGGEIERLCRALVAARTPARRSRVTLRLPNVVVDGRTARTMLAVAGELISNGVRYALAERGGKLEVRIERLVGSVVLTVADDGPGMASSTRTSGTGLGGALVSELVSRASGTIECDTGPGGTCFHVALPVADQASDARSA